MMHHPNNKNNATPPPPRALADVLSDPSAQWSEVRNAMRAHGRGSTRNLMGDNSNMTATTNAGMIKALQESNAISCDHSSTPNCTQDFSAQSAIAAVAAASANKDDCACGHVDAEELSNLAADKLSIDPQKQTSVGDRMVTGNGESSSVGSTENAAARPCAPPRGLTRLGSAKGASWRGSLRNVVEDEEASMDDMESTTSSTDGGSSAHSLSAGSSSGPRIIPARHLPRSGSGLNGSFRTKSENEFPPARRLPPRQKSARSASWRGSLKNVLEDVEQSDLDDSADDENEGSIHFPDRVLEEVLNSQRRQSHPAARRQRAGARLNGKASRVGNSMTSIQLNSSCSTVSSVESGGLVAESINIMDFGCDPDARPFTESMLSLDVSDTTSRGQSMSDLVDSQGFLAWKKDGSSSTLLNYQPTSKRRALKRADSCETESEQSISVDSQGFVGWKSLPNDDNTATVREKTESESKFTGGGKVDETGEELEKSWRIEDYENLDHCPKIETRFGSLGEQLRRISSNVSEGMLSVKRHSSSSNNDTEIDELVKTEDVKRVLLGGLPSGDSLRSAGKQCRPRNASRRNSAFSSFFGRRRSSDDDISDCEDGALDARPAIRINKEDGVDIEEMRRELVRAGATEEHAKTRLKLAFF